MPLRPSTICLGTILALSVLLAGVLLKGSLPGEQGGPDLQQKRALVRALELTDLCLFTEASYTRHLSMSDLSTPFQDSPASLEHFPTGALAAPPDLLVKRYAETD
ncbi:MAG: hypothetical protein A2X58_12500 [Nitrospirae bacterium GWC2_56_14]|nr:MAG: hypothetical protein A2X58_12500 [Nitrospirae bacterium GWC2_56_14]